MFHVKSQMCILGLTCMLCFQLISSVVTRDYEHIIRTCELDNWKEALAVILTYAEGEDFASLCTVLGDRLQSAGGSHTPSACLCYICAGSIERLVECWAKTTPNPNSPDVLSVRHPTSNHSFFEVRWLLFRFFYC